MKKWTFGNFFNNPLGNLMLLFGVGMMIGGLWYLISNNYIIIKW